MPRFTTKLAALLAATGLLAVGGAGVAAGRDDDHRGDRGDERGERHGGDRFSGDETFKAFLNGYEEVPAVSSPASGSFRASLDEDAGELRWQLRYRDIETPVQQAHVHFGQPAVNGGVSIFLCSNLPGAPADVQRCPASSGTISGTATAASVVGPAAQGIEPGELDELLDAMRAGVTYVNVHTDAFENGEIRGQIGGHGGDDD